MSLDPDIAALLEMVQAGTESGARIPFPQLTAAQARADFDASSPLLDVDPPALAYERQLSLPTRDGAMIDARLYALEEPSSRNPVPVLLYMHGGGFVVGSLDSHQPLCRGLAEDSGAAVLSIAYRLAPEHKFPTAFEDAVDALTWIGREGLAAGIDAGRVAVGGDSAGGTLAAALAIAAKADRSLPQPVLQVLAYPGLSSPANVQFLRTIWFRLSSGTQHRRLVLPAISSRRFRPRRLALWAAGRGRSLRAASGAHRACRI